MQQILMHFHLEYQQKDISRAYHFLQYLFDFRYVYINFLRYQTGKHDIFWVLNKAIFPVTGTWQHQSIALKW